MSSAIAKIKGNRFFPLIVVLYLVYLTVLFLLLIPYLPEIVQIFSDWKISPDEHSSAPLLPLGIAALIPLAVIYIGTMDQRILGLTTLYLLIQLVFNAIVFVVLILMDFDLYRFSETESIFSIWLFACVSSVVTISLNTSISWKWVKSGIRQPGLSDWLFSYIIYLITIYLVVKTVEVINPTTRGILLWPLPGIVFVGALSYFIVSFGILVIGLEILMAPYSNSQSDAGIFLALMALGAFLVMSVFLLFFHLFNYYIGVFIVNWKNRKQPSNIA